jgi:hypothetical protein
MAGRPSSYTEEIALERPRVEFVVEAETRHVVKRVSSSPYEFDYVVDWSTSEEEARRLAAERARLK